jgi:ubiquitin thioesterase OTU1
MAPLRVRHPKGVATLNVDISSDSSTVLDLQQEIRTVTDILPSQQERAWSRLPVPPARL